MTGAVAKKKAGQKGRGRRALSTRSGLAPLHARFVREYLTDLNARAAARRAGYSERSAHDTGSRLLQRDDVRAEIARLEEARWLRLDISADRVDRELAAVGFSNLADVLQVEEYGFEEPTAPAAPDAPVPEGEQKAEGEQEPEDELFDLPPAYGLRVRMPTDLRSLPRHVQAAVKKVAETKDGFRIEMHDKLAALDKLGKRLRLWQEHDSDAVQIHYVVHVPPPVDREEWEQRYAGQHLAKGREIAGLPAPNGSGNAKQGG